MTYFRKRLPLIFLSFGQATPLFANDLGYGRIRQTGIGSNHRCLLVLAIKNEGWKAWLETRKAGPQKPLPLRGLGILGSGWQRQN
jgi:hypothetical protein